jgi:hypothetical protein
VSRLPGTERRTSTSRYSTSARRLADAGRPAEAATVLDRALALRTAAGDAGLVASTEAALERLRRQA